MTPVDEIKNRLDIVDVIQGYIRLKKAGKDYKALCPFHKEKNASFYVSPSKQIWHCFSCNMGGDMFTFVEKIEGVEFPDALRTLAKKAGVILRKQDPKLQSKRKVLYDICEEATNFFEEQLNKNKPIQEYLKNRGLQSKTIKDFQVGFALDSWDALYKYLTDLGYKAENIEKAGLLVKKEGQSKYYDRFRNRIMFPIFDLNGQIVGFSGRIYGKEDEKKAKYVNTPETIIYNKSMIVYGLDKAKIEIRKKNQCVLVEGQFDVIMAHQAGSQNTIAISGTALTLEHLKILKRYTENLVFSFDADSGGEKATKRAVGLAQQLEFNVKVVLLPKDKDPADIIKEDSKKWENLLEKNKPVIDFYFDNIFSKYSKNLTVDDKREIAKELLYPIKNIVNSVEQAHWIQALASKLKVEEKILVEALRRIRSRETGEKIISPPKTHKKTRTEELVEYLLGLILKYPKNRSHFIKNFKESFLAKPEYKKIFNDLKSNQKPSKEDSFLTKSLIFKIEHCNLENKEVPQEIDCCIKEIKSIKLKKEMGQVSLELKQLENQSKTDSPERKKLTQSFSKLAEELNNLNE